MSEYIEREAAEELISQPITMSLCLTREECLAKRSQRDRDVALLHSIPAADVRPVPDGGIGEMSDGYHTFNGLYYQRMILFAALVKQNKGKAWKSWRHEDGELCFGGGWFIVGIDTPQGSYTYHYEAKDFDLFDCEELPVAKHWDGHTEEDVTRLLSLPEVRPVVRGEWETVSVPKPITNADRIRAMTDEKLAEWLAHYTSWTEFGEKMAKERWLIYLRQEVTND